MDYRIVENSALARIARVYMKAPAVAMVIGKKIHLSGVSKDHFLLDKKWLAHELVHVDQFKKYGLWRFIFLYMAETFKKGYYHNKFEVEARERAKEIA